MPARGKLQCGIDPSIADGAEVSVQTVFAHFPTKRDLLKEVIDQAIVGDDKPVPARNRPEVAAIVAEPIPNGSFVSMPPWWSRWKSSLPISSEAAIYERVFPLTKPQTASPC
jgi:AcrR family transcriptional regulator